LTKQGWREFTQVEEVDQMRTGARKGLLGRPALVVGVGVVVLCAGSSADQRDAPRDRTSVASSQRASRQSKLAPGRLAWTNEDG
jgi:hypothetical protein